MRALRSTIHPLARPLPGSIAIVLAFVLLITTLPPRAAATRSLPLPGSPQKIFPADPGSLGSVPDGLDLSGQCGTPRDVTFTVIGMSAPLTNVEVSFTLNPAHTFVGDLELTLIAPNNGPKHLLFNRTGAWLNNGYGDNSYVDGPYNFKDSASTNPHWWTAAATAGTGVFVAPGDYRAVGTGPMSSSSAIPPFTLITPAFNTLTQTQANGTWTLRIRDCKAVHTGTVSAASLTLAGPCKNCSSCRRLSDFDGDGLNDVAVFRPSENNWYSKNSSNGMVRLVYWGAFGDKIVPGDYDGDGVTDYAIWRPPGGEWWILSGADPSKPQLHQLGEVGDAPVPMDYDGDGKVDIAVWDPAPAPPTWRIHFSAGGTLAVAPPTSSPADIPVPRDYNGDCKADLAVYRPSTGDWHIFDNAGNTISVQHLAVARQVGDIPVPADYDSDGKTDLAVYRPSNGTWYIGHSSTGQEISIQWGVGGDIPVPACYDGDEKTDMAIYRPSEGNWYILQSAGLPKIVNWGAPGDIIVPAAYNP